MFYICLSICLIGSLLIFYFNYRLFIQTDSFSSSKNTKNATYPQTNTTPSSMYTNSSSSLSSSSNTTSTTITHQPWNLFMLWGGTLPLICLFINLTISLCYHFRGINYTRGCRTRNQVFNIIPSISACLGDYMPQAGIWRICVMLYVWQRIFAGYIQYFHYGQATKWQSPKLTLIRTIVHITEQLALIGLSSISSMNHLMFHEISFGVFCASSCLNMVLTDRLIRLWIVQSTLTTNELQPLHVAKRAHNWRFYTSVFNFTCLGLAVYYFLLSEQNKCIDYQYSKFALFEWLYVISNIIYQHSEQIELSYIDLGLIIMPQKLK